MKCTHEGCNKKAIGMTSVQTKDMEKSIKGIIKTCQKHLEESCENDT